MKYRFDLRYAFLFFVFAVACVALLHAYQHIDRCSQPKMSEDWMRCIELLGPEAAQSHFKRLNDVVPFPESHQRAHQFGYALNHLYGISGVKYCDWEYQGGCTHGVVAAEILKRGAGAGSTVGEECESEEQSPMHRNCYHSLGHGFVSIFGIDEPALSESLTQCDALQSLVEESTTHREDCYEGVFMEYNQHTLSGEKSPRILDKEDVYGPCNRLEAKYKSACYFRLTRLWAISAGTSSDAVFKMWVRWCDDMPDSKHHNRCINGVNSAMGYAGVTSGLRRLELCGIMYSDLLKRGLCEQTALEGP